MVSPDAKCMIPPSGGTCQQLWANFFVRFASGQGDGYLKRGLPQGTRHILPIHFTQVKGFMHIFCQKFSQPQPLTTSSRGSRFRSRPAPCGIGDQAGSMFWLMGAGVEKPRSIPDLPCLHFGEEPLLHAILADRLGRSLALHRAKMARRPEGSYGAANRRYRDKSSVQAGIRANDPADDRGFR